MIARYCLHLRDGTDELLDPEGTEYRSLDVMRRAVMTTVRGLMSGDIAGGVVDLRYRIDVENGDGAIIYTLPFKHAVNIIPEASL